MIQRLLKVRSKRGQRGITTVEMVVATPLLVLLMLGAVDFGRVMYAGMTAANAARAGAGYGAQTDGTAAHYDGMISSALGDATNLSIDAYNLEHVVVTPRRFCRCVGGSGEVDCINHGCAEAPEVYVEVTAVRDFHTVVPYPLIPNSLQLSRTAIIRVR